MTEKTFDRADLLKFFDESGQSAIVGKLTVIMPPKDLYSDVTNEHYPIAAETKAFWCDRYGFAVVVQRVNCTGLYHLPHDHTLRTEKPLHFRYGGGATSAELSRWAMGLADEWRTFVRMYMPHWPVDLRGPVADEATDAPTPAQAVAEPQSEPKPEPTDKPADDDHDATGISIDDVFGEDGAE